MLSVAVLVNKLEEMDTELKWKEKGIPHKYIEIAEVQITESSCPATAINGSTAFHPFALWYVLLSYFLLVSDAS